MLSKTIEKLFNEQIEKEGYSSLLYLSMASWAEKKGFQGISEWLYAQAAEEKIHMLEFIHYVNDRGGYATVPGLDAPPKDFEDVKTLFEQVLKHEQFISELINKIVAACISENDFTTQNWLQAFVSEQIEEENSVQNILDKLNLVGQHNMYMFDRDIMSLRNTSSNNTNE